MSGTHLVKISESAAKRLTDVLRQRPIIHRAPDSNRNPLASEDGFWARITDADRDTGRYSWVPVELQPPDGSDFTPRDNYDWAPEHHEKDDDDGYAMEIYGSKNVLLDIIVWMQPSFSQDYLVFEFKGGAAQGSITGDIMTGNLGEVVIGQNGRNHVQAYCCNAIYLDDGETVGVVYDCMSKVWQIVVQSCGE